MTRDSASPIDSDKDETTVVTRVGMPPVPTEYKDTHFERMVTVMATFVDEVRGYRSDLMRKSEVDARNWTTMQHEIAGVRSDFSTLKTELEQFRAGMRREVEDAKRGSDSKIQALEARIDALGREVERLTGLFAAHESGRAGPERGTLEPLPDGTPAKTV